MTRVKILRYLTHFSLLYLPLTIILYGLLLFMQLLRIAEVIHWLRSVEAGVLFTTGTCLLIKF